ncbi:hypothetical protein OH77DRAFT_1393273 [Trametes cingulata]|nr:hypothetical protein OH77DRAFT_1393273 [Trametes cingulata]
MSGELDESDSESTLRLQQEIQRVQQRLREERKISEPILQTFRASWRDYYTEEPRQSSQLLTSLRVAVPSRPRVSSFYDHDEEGDFDAIDRSATSGASLVVWSADQGRASALSIRSGVAFEEPMSLYAYPKYESCTPSLVVIKFQGDPYTVQFIPYADEPRFQRRIERYSSRFARFAWQAEWYDVDYKLIAADAVLHLEASGRTVMEIERYKPHFMPSLVGEHGLMVSLRRRDLPSWANSILQSRRTVPKALRHSGILADVNRMVALFCSSINCNAPRCMFHVEYTSEAFPLGVDTTEEKKLDEAQGILNTYRGLNYMFNVVDTNYILDAATVGNVTRCLNDPMDEKKANVRAESESYLPALNNYH